MTTQIITPPGFEHRKLPRTVKPDVQKILALLRQKGISEQQFAEMCGRGDAGFFRHWKNGDVNCYVRLLNHAAQALQLKNWWELWADYTPPASESIKKTEEEYLIEKLAVKTLLNPTYGLNATGQPMESTNFQDQVIAKFPIEMYEFLDNEAAIISVFRDLEDMGWLVANADGTFSRRYWTMLEGMASIEYRCGAEDGAMAAVAMLQSPTWGNAKTNLETYEAIIADQHDRLEKLHSEHKRVQVDRDEDAASQVIRLDDSFHRRWSFTPCIDTSFGFALTTIDQSTNRFIETLKRCKMRGIEVPSNFPTLPSLVQNYYPQLRGIFEAFVRVEPNDFAGLMKVRKLLVQHARDGFDTVNGAETLIDRWAGRPDG